MAMIDNIYVSKEGLEFRILKKGAHWCTIYNDDREIMSRATILNITKGEARLLKNNGGYIKCKSPHEYGQLIKTSAYSCWTNMLNRVGKGKYERVEIHEDWLNFLTFKRFYDTWHRDGFVLDKDLLSKGTKIYSEDTCCFIPAVLNTAIRECNSNARNPADSLVFCMSFHLGRSETVQCKNKSERNTLYNLYRVVKVRTLLSLYDTQIRKEAIERIYQLYNIKDYGKNTDSSTL